MVRFLSHPALFDIQETELESKEIISLRARIAIILETQPLALPDRSEQVHDLLTFCKNYQKLIGWYLEHGDISRALEVWRVLPNPTPEIFIRDLIFQVLSSSSWNRFWRHLLRHPSDLLALRSFIDDLFIFLKQREMGLTLYKIQFALELFDDARETAHFAFTAARSWVARLKFCASIKAAVAKSLSLSQKFTVERVELQERILHLFIRLDIPFQESLSILGSPESARAVGLELLRLGEADLCVEVKKQAKVSLQDITAALVRSFPPPTEDLAPFQAFPRSIEKCSEAAYADVVVSYFTAVVREAKLTDLLLIKKLIGECVLDSFKGRMFCKFNFFEEALEVATKTRDTALREEIAKKASGAGLNKKFKSLK
jgi:hypothetical protein